MGHYRSLIVTEFIEWTLKELQSLILILKVQYAELNDFLEDSENIITSLIAHLGEVY